MYAIYKMQQQYYFAKFHGYSVEALFKNIAKCSSEIAKRLAFGF